MCVQPCDPRENFFPTFPCSHVYKQGAVTEIVRSLPTKTLTFSGDALEDVPVCTCKKRDGPLCHPRLENGLCAKISVSGRFSRFFLFSTSDCMWNMSVTFSCSCTCVRFADMSVACHRWSLQTCQLHVTFGVCRHVSTCHRQVDVSRQV